MADEFEVKSADEIEQLSEEDQTQYETDLADYTEKNLESELESQGADEEETDISETEETVGEELESDTNREEDNYKARYEGLTPKLNQQAEEIRELKEKLEGKKEVAIDQDEIFDPEKWRDLLDSNPQEASDYYYKSYIKPQMTQENAIATQESEIANAQNLTVKSISEFSKLDEVVKVMEGKPELGDAFGKFLTSQVQAPRTGFKVEDLQKAWKWFRHEEVITETKEQAKRDTIQQLNDANPDVITLTNAKDSKAIGNNLKKMNREQAAELGNSMSDEELNKLLDDRIG